MLKIVKYGIVSSQGAIAADMSELLLDNILRTGMEELTPLWFSSETGFRITKSALSIACFASSNELNFVDNSGSKYPILELEMEGFTYKRKMFNPPPPPEGCPSIVTDVLPSSLLIYKSGCSFTSLSKFIFNLFSFS